MNVKLYTTHCPQCEILKKKLSNKNITFVEIYDKQIMIKKGFLSAPMLEVDGEIMDFYKANNWINQL